MACGSLYIPESGKLNGNCDLLEELNILKEIYLNEITFKNSSEGLCCIQLQIQPATGEHIDKKLVSVLLNITPLENYPQTPPKIVLSCPRGLSEKYLNELLIDVKELADKKNGFPMIYDLVEYVKESLTNNNIPSTQCMICLELFEVDSHDILKTDCYHYFHNECLLRYKLHIKEDRKTVKPTENYEIFCPVCRSVIDDDITRLPAVPLSFEDDTNFKYVPLKEILEMRRNMEILFLKQKRQGGIIDLEEEKNKFLIITT